MDMARITVSDGYFYRDSRLSLALPFTSTIDSVLSTGFEYAPDATTRIRMAGEDFRYDDAGHPASGLITAIYGYVEGNLAYSVTDASLTIALLLTITPESRALGGKINLMGGDDSFFGGSLGDIYSGWGGHDVIMGGDGSDWLNGDDGNDHLYGQSPNGGPDRDDTISGGAGSDYIQGNAGSDDLSGDDGSDRIFGGAGSDFIFGGTGNDTVNGNLGDDFIDGWHGDDSVRGGQGNDVITGGFGYNVIMGDLGNDTINANGADTITGGQGRDHFVLSIRNGDYPVLATPRYVITDFTKGDDIIVLSSATGARPSSVLTGRADSYQAALTTAQALVDGHEGLHEVAAIQVGGDTYLFYGGIADQGALSVSILAQGVSAAAFELNDFAF